MVKSLGNIIAQDDSRGDASSVAIVVIDIGSSGVDPGSFSCIHATRYQFVGTLWQSHTNFPSRRLPGAVITLPMDKQKESDVNAFNKFETRKGNSREKNRLSYNLERE